jgi:hypothetical protein
LSTLSGEPAELTVKVDEGKPPFISARAYVSEVLDENLGWYLREPNDERAIGWRCILMTKARREAIAHCELVDGDKILVKSLRIVRPSESGKALLCEVAEYCDGGDSSGE